MKNAVKHLSFFLFFIIIALISINGIKSYNKQIRYATGSETVQVMVDGTLYCRVLDNQNDFTSTPNESEISGTITSLIIGRSPIENDQTNREECLNQPYAFVDDKLLVRTKVYGVNYMGQDYKLVWCKMEPINS